LLKHKNKYSEQVFGKELLEVRNIY